MRMCSSLFPTPRVYPAIPSPIRKLGQDRYDWRSRSGRSDGAWAKLGAAVHLRKIGALVAASASTIAAISGGHAAALTKTSTSRVTSHAVLITFRHRVDAVTLADASRYAETLKVRR